MWYVSKTLMTGEPDCNRRYLNRGAEVIATFNKRMTEWRPDDSEALADLAMFLNKLELAHRQMLDSYALASYPSMSMKTDEVK